MPTKRVMTDLSGKIIGSGAIQLINPVGAGSFGTVYRAQNLKPTATCPRWLAVKVLPVPGNSVRRARHYRREIRLHSTVSKHPNVVSFHAVYRDQNYLYLVMTYYPGGDLHRMITRRDAFVGNDALLKSLFIQLIDAVQSCHKFNVFHRDIKPGNVFINEDHTQVYLGDFGLAWDLAWSDRYGAGSSYWMCPGKLSHSTLIFD